MASRLAGSCIAGTAPSGGTPSSSPQNANPNSYVNALNQQVNNGFRQQRAHGVYYPGCSGKLNQIGACPSEGALAGNTPQEVKESLIGAGSILSTAIPGDAIAGAVARIARTLFATRAADSVWGLGWAARGLAIEQKLGGNLPASFPTIDRFENGVATSIKSVDLSTSTYQSTSRLTSTLTGYVDKVAGFNGAAFNGTRITAGQITSRGLDIAIPRGVATQAQSGVLSQISTYGQSVGVNVNIVEIP